MMLTIFRKKMRKTLEAEQILLALKDRPVNKRMIRANSTNKALIKALTIADEIGERLPQQVLCDILGEKHAKTAILILMSHLDSHFSQVRGSAADALGKVGDSRAGLTLLQHFETESDAGARRAIVASLGSVHYKPAVSLLTNLLTDNDIYIREQAAWSLGLLNAQESLEALQIALIKDPDYEMIRMAINKLTSSSTTLSEN